MNTQKELAHEAESIQNRLQLIRLLRNYGEAHVVGSVALELLVKLDLDIHVLVQGFTLNGAMNNITNELLDKPEIREVRISDYRPKGIKIGVDECPGPSGNWTIDIWLTTDQSTVAFEHTKRLLSELTPEDRDTILSLKRHYYERGRLRDGISSVIYEAVLGGVKNVNEFESSSYFVEYIQDSW